MYLLALLAAVAAAVTDMRRREIPDWVPLSLFLLSLGACAAGRHPGSWGGLLLGVVVAFGFSFILFQLRLLGGGDVKLLTAMGAALGWPAFLPFLLGTGLCGGVIALLARRSATGAQEIAYAPAMVGGLLLLLPLAWLGT